MSREVRNSREPGGRKQKKRQRVTLGRFLKGLEFVSFICVHVYTVIESGCEKTIARSRDNVIIKTSSIC